MLVVREPEQLRALGDDLRAEDRRPPPRARTLDDRARREARPAEGNGRPPREGAREGRPDPRRADTRRCARSPRSSTGAPRASSSSRAPTTQTARTSGTSRRLPSGPRPRRCFPSATTTGRPSPSCEFDSPTPTRGASSAGSTSSPRTSSPPTTPTASRTALAAGVLPKGTRCVGCAAPPAGSGVTPTSSSSGRGQTISEFGSQISQLAIPWLAAVGLHASPFEFSILGMLGFLPFMLFALPAGVWVDRLRRRPILIVGDAARARAPRSIPILWAIGHAPRSGSSIVLEFVVGIFTVFFDVAYQSYLPRSSNAIS